MIKFMTLSCSVVRAVCQISNGVLIMILHQVHFIGGLKSSDNRPAMRYQNTVSNVTLIQLLKKQDVVCVNVLPEATENITLFMETNDTQMAHIMFKYKNASITLQDDFNNGFSAKISSDTGKIMNV